MMCKVVYYVMGKNGEWEKQAHKFKNANSVLVEDRTIAKEVHDVDGDHSRAFGVNDAVKTRTLSNELLACTVTATGIKSGEVRQFPFENVDLVDCRIPGEYLKVHAVQGGTMEIENDNRGAEDF